MEAKNHVKITQTQQTDWGQSLIEHGARNFALVGVSAYRVLIRPHLGPACRFIPSCSEYAVVALKQHSFLNASKLILNRLGRCRPGGSCGYDPVPGIGEYGKQ